MSIGQIKLEDDSGTGNAPTPANGCCTRPRILQSHGSTPLILLPNADQARTDFPAVLVIDVARDTFNKASHFAICFPTFNEQSHHTTKISDTANSG